MNKKYLLFIIPVFIISLLLFVGKNNNTSLSEEKIIKNENTLAIMIQSAPGSETYNKSSAIAFPTTGYVFNSTRSYCDKEGTISWNDQTNKIDITSRYPQKCYIYFDLDASNYTASNVQYINSTYTSCTTVECALNELYNVF